MKDYIQRQVLRNLFYFDYVVVTNIRNFNRHKINLFTTNKFSLCKYAKIDLCFS